MFAVLKRINFFIIMLIALAGCGTVPEIPQRVFNVGDSVVVISGELSGLRGTVNETDRSRVWYTVDFDNHIQARRMHWNQLQH